MNLEQLEHRHFRATKLLNEDHFRVARVLVNMIERLQEENQGLKDEIRGLQYQINHPSKPKG